MSTIFILCALGGGTVLVIQFVLTLVGLGDHGYDLADDVPDSVGIDGADFHDVGTSDVHHADHGSNWFFGIISFRTVTAAAAFFGLSGMAARSGGLGIAAQLLIAIVCGGTAMVAVHRLMQTFYRLGQSGTLRISNTVGKTATVYIPIPGGNAGQGKVQVKVQGRLEEFPAVTSAEKLATGAKVVVVGVVSSNTLEVEPARETVETEA